MKSVVDNRKTKYTKMVIRESLFKLMATRSIAKITVTDICKEADINRGTFYSHYYDAYDLLDQIQSEFQDEIGQSLNKLSVTVSSSEMLLEIFTTIYKNRNLCKIILSENGSKDFLNSIINIAYEKCTAEWRKMFPDFTDNELAYYYSFFSNGVVGIIQKWVHDNFQESPKVIAKYVNNFIDKSL